MSVLFCGSALAAGSPAAPHHPITEPDGTEEGVHSEYVATRLALEFLFGTSFTEAVAKGLLASGGAVAREGIDFWTVTITRIDLETLDTPRMAAVDRITGEVRRLIPHDHLHGGTGQRLIPEMRPWGL